MCVVLIPSERLLPWSPFENVVWAGLESPITEEEVLEAMSNGEFETDPVPVWDYFSKPATRETHVRRIAFLAMTSRILEPISIDVGIPEMGFHVDWIIDDGNHRLAAFLIGQASHVPAYVMGSSGYAKELLGVDIEWEEDDAQYPSDA